jgi:hypothetical protein
LNLLALSELTGLLGGQEGGDLLAKCLVLNFVELRAGRQVSQSQFPEATGEQDAASGQPASWVLTTQFSGPAAHPLGQPEGFACGHTIRKQLTNLTQFGVVEITRQRVHQGKDVIELHSALLALGEVGEHLIEDAA